MRERAHLAAGERLRHAGPHGGAHVAELLQEAQVALQPLHDAGVRALQALRSAGEMGSGKSGDGGSHWSRGRQLLKQSLR